MPRLKGSKNKKNIAAANVDYAALIAEKDVCQSGRRLADSV